MTTFLSLLFLLSGLLVIVGLISPKWLANIPGTKGSRLGVLKIFGSAAVILFILIAIFAPTSGKIEKAKGVEPVSVHHAEDPIQIVDATIANAAYINAIYPFAQARIATEDLLKTKLTNTEDATKWVQYADAVLALWKKADNGIDQFS
ncbi:MAG TPA: hypothetical protein VN397_02055, partial [Candidatus Methylomirabilis sp.]|nr:hypothetical protein [Candidatus Methylomirabilis sp.]